MATFDCDILVMGSGFGGSVSALRLVEKGYRVLVVEQGKWYGPADFAQTNWNLRKWLWAPALGLQGIMKISLLRHVGVLSGVGVGGGSLVYAGTLPVPPEAFFRTGHWAGLADWQQELKPFYALARKMLGVQLVPRLFDADEALRELARALGKESAYRPAEVGVFFGAPGKTVADPYFGGAGPARTGCTYCGACMTGCRVGAKNSLDQNYLYLAMAGGAKVLAEHKVVDVRPIGAADGSEGYEVTLRPSLKWWRKRRIYRVKGIVFAGGVMGTVPLLLKLRARSLPRLSPMVGQHIRTNNETLVSVTTLARDRDFSRGLAIGSILHTDRHSHLEAVRYGAGSGFWRLSHLPHVVGAGSGVRLRRMIEEVMRDLPGWLRLYTTGDWARRTVVLLFMQTLDSTLRFRKTRWGGVNTDLSSGPPPSADIPESTELVRRFAQLVDGKATAFFQQIFQGKAVTAHILGGAVMGRHAGEGVIDTAHRVFGYQNMWVIDGAAVSANPGVNPSLTIAAMAERAMSLIPENTRPPKSKTYSADSD